MEDFLTALSELLKKHNATILRSAASEHDLVISVGEKSKHGEAVGFKEISFEEEIGEISIHNKWYKAL